METRAPIAVVRGAAAALLVLAAAGCGNGSSATARTEGVADVGPLPAPGPAVEDGAVVTSTTIDPVSTDPAETADLPEASTSIAPDTVDSGVPGVDDAQAMCAAWARFAGSTQLLAIASNFGDLDPVALARLEVVAAPVIRSSVADLDRLLPAEVADEHVAFIDQVLGPAGRRATRAEAYLTDAGAEGVALITIATAWLDALRTHDPESAVPDLPALDPVMSGEVDAAAARFAAEVTRFSDDPSLDTSAVATPATNALLAEQCPDLTAFGVGDAI